MARNTTLSDAEIAKLLTPANLKLPAKPKVLEIKFEDYEDWAGDDSLRVFIIIDPKTPDRQRRWKQLGPIHRAISEALYAAGETRFAYITHKTPVEYARRYNPFDD